MSVILAATWNPRGEAKRFRRLFADLSQLYAHMIVILPPGTHMGLILSLQHYDRLSLIVSDNWPGGRYESLKRALAVMPRTSAAHIQYADMDRLLRWAETQYEELRQIVKRIQITDCLVIGRTLRAYATHPQALIQTEALPNRVFSHMLGQKLDLSAGSKGFSREAAQFIVEHGEPAKPMGADAEWVVLMKRGGFRIHTVEVDGLDWESADRYQNQAADSKQQEAAATAYDADAANWQHRLQVANEILEAGLATFTRELAGPK